MASPVISSRMSAMTSGWRRRGSTASAQEHECIRPRLVGPGQARQPMTGFRRGCIGSWCEDKGRLWLWCGFGY